MYKILFCMLLGISIFPGVTFAGDDHNHEAAVEPAPHGGILRDAPPYKVELVLNGDKANVYVYDSALKPIEKERLSAQAKGNLGFPKQASKEVSLSLGQDSYEGTLQGIGSVYRFDFHLKIIIDGKEVIGDFGIDNIH